MQNSNDAPSPEKTGVNHLIGQTKVLMSEEGEIFVSFKTETNGHLHTEHHPLKSKAVETWVRRCLRKLNNRSPKPHEIEAAIADLEALAYEQTNATKVYIRCGEHSGKIYIDLGNPSWEAIEVSAAGWSIIDEPPVAFKRPKSLKPLPRPTDACSFDAARGLFNFETEEDYYMLIAWMFHSFFSRGPYPILAIGGEHGSAKTTTCMIIKALIDPSTPATRSLPETERDLTVAANNNWVLCFDNISIVKPWLSDALCRLATGAGFGIRQHYQDSQEVIFEASRPIIINGIEDIAQQQDLISRVIPIRLAPIPDDKRVTEDEIWAKVEEVSPMFFAAVLNLLSECLKNIENIKPTQLPRMADFAKRVLSVETLIGFSQNGFLDHYRSIQSAASADALAGDDVFVGILKLLNGKPQWVGSAGELCEQILQLTEPRKRKYIPKANKLPLTRLKPILRAHGIGLEKDRSSLRRTITLTNDFPHRNLLEGISETSPPKTAQELLSMQVSEVATYDE